MGTKNNPGTFDCYANAEPDEPMFILLARDPSAPMLVELWAQIRERFGGNTREIETDLRMADEAQECAETMREWHRRNRS